MGTDGWFTVMDWREFCIGTLSVYFSCWALSNWSFVETSLFLEDSSVFLSLMHSTPLYSCLSNEQVFICNWRATGSIKIDPKDVLNLGKLWSSDTLIDFANGLSEDTTNANAGNLTGNRMFYLNDYMVCGLSNHESGWECLWVSSRFIEVLNMF